MSANQSSTRTTETDKVQLVDLGWQFGQIAAEVEADVLDALRAGRYVGGETVALFESEFAKYSQSDHCIAVANGTDALELSLRAVGVKPGHSVALPANTFIATAGAVARIGAEPVLVDCGPDHLMDVDQLENCLQTSSVTAIVPVHLYGQLANMEPIQELAAKYGAALVADGAQSQGALRSGQGMGRFASVTSTSFYPGKNLGATGDAGAVLTSDADLARQIRLMANHGSEVRYQHEIVGVNSRLDNIHAIVLRAKLKKLNAWNEQRRAIANVYSDILSTTDGVEIPRTAATNTHVWHLYVVQVNNRDAVVEYLNANGVGASIHYPVPVHLQPAFSSLGHQVGDFPVAEAATSRILSLPIHPGMTKDQAERVCAVLAEAISAA